MRTYLLLAVLLGVAYGASLQSYNIDLSQTTVSGLSAGGFMAYQMHVAFSENIVGSAIFAGGPSLCAEGSESTALTTCMSSPLLLNVSKLEGDLKGLASKGEIDSLDNLKGDKVYIYSGESDSVVKTAVVKAGEKMFTNLGADVTTEYSINSEHAYPTNNFGNKCTFKGSPYINNCDYNGAEESFKVLFGDDLKPAVDQVSANLLTFSQGSYAETDANISLGLTGYVYVPTACQNGDACRLHIALHGCQQTVADIKDEYASKLGMNELAEANNIVILYPQAKKSYVSPSNPQGCFDWWGYTTPGMLPVYNKKDYVTKSGPQMAAIWNMAKALSSGSSEQKTHEPTFEELLEELLEYFLN